MDDWLDALDDKDKKYSKPELRALTDDEPQPEPDHDAVADTTPDVEDEPQPQQAAKKKSVRAQNKAKRKPARKKTPDSDTKKKKSTAVPMAIACGFLLVVVGVATTFLTQADHSTKQPDSAPQPVAEDAQAKGPQPVETTTDKVAEVGDLCSGNSAIDVSEEDSPRAAIAEFEQAYFNADAQGVKAALSPDSEIRDQDWKKILASAAPEGTKYCLTMQPSQGETTSVELEVKKPKEDKAQLYKQKVTAKKSKGSWAVHSIGRED